jgi:hypothetical protein
VGAGLNEFIVLVNGVGDRAKKKRIDAREA